MAIDLSPYHAVLLDLDGTIYHEDHPLPGAIELIRHLQSIGKPFACLSNSTSSPLRISMRLRTMGVEVVPTDIYTAAAATCDYVLQRAPVAPDERDSDEPPARKRVFNLATEAIHEMLEGLVDFVRSGGEPCDAIIVGAPSNPFADSDRQRIALQLARRGARIVGICADRVYPSPRGIEFGAGALTYMLAYASGQTPVFCGKPERIFFSELTNRMNLDPNWCVLVGDNIEADILGAKGAGMRTILTLSGVTRRRDLLSLPAESQPDLVVEDLSEFLK